MTDHNNLTDVTGGLGRGLTIIETTWTIEGDPEEVWVWVWGAPATVWTWGQADYLSRLGLLLPCEIIPSLEADQ